MKVAVGSTNPIKILAIEQAASLVWTDVEIIAIDAPSGVRIQPMSNLEAIHGAKNRAYFAIESSGADYGVGIESSVEDSSQGLFLTGWIVVVNRDGREGIAGQERLLLPDVVATQIRSGAELGPVMDSFVGIKDVKSNQGAIGIFTNGMIMRADTYTHTFKCALAPFLHPEWYK